MTILEKKINKTREAMQMCIARAERIQEMQKRLNEEIKDDHIHLEDPFYQESIFEELI